MRPLNIIYNNKTRSSAYTTGHNDEYMPTNINNYKHNRAGLLCCV